MAKSKYEGGAKITTFRLPKLKFEEAKKGIEDYLDRFRTNKAVDDISDPVTAFWDGKDPFLEKAKKMVDDAYVLPKNSKVNISKDLAEKLLELDPKIVVPEINKAKNVVSKKKQTNEKPISYDWPRPSMEEVEKKFNDEVIKMNGGIVKFPCGCFRDNFLFRRVGNCKIKIEDHKEFYSKEK